MLKKQPANQDKVSAKEIPHIAATDVFSRPRSAGFETDVPSLLRYLTLKNIVMGLGLATFLIFLGSAVSARIAFLFAALLGLAGLVLMEMASRRKWEAELMSQLRQMNGDYERLVREVARSRNDMSVLKKSLSDAGALARSYGRKQGEAVEQRMIRAIADQLSRLSDADLPAEEEVLMPDLGDAKNISSEQVVQLVHAAVKQDRVDLFMQPIVNLPQRKTRFYETFSRIRIGEDNYLPAEKYIGVALQQNLLPAIDNLLLLRALQFIRDADADVGTESSGAAFFCNITSLTLNDPKFMGDLVEFIAQNRTLAPRLIFELGQRDLATMSADVLPILQGLASLGCRFSMDLVKSLSFDFAHLEARHIRFIKADAALVLNELKQLGGRARMKRLKSELDRHGIDLIVEKIETERQTLELLDIDIDYGQGFLFGKPAKA